MFALDTLVPKVSEPVVPHLFTSVSVATRVLVLTASLPSVGHDVVTSSILLVLFNLA